jgi:hypothetical protein
MKHTIFRWNLPSWPYYVTIGIIVFLFLPLSWTHYLWIKYIAKFESHLPTNILIRFLYNTSKLITNSVVFRLLIYTIVYGLFCLCVLTEWMDCYKYTAGDANPVMTKKNFLILIGSRVNNLTSEVITSHCVIPWHMTETCGLAIIMSFLFLRMYMWLKLIYASVIALVYSFCILEFSGAFYGVHATMLLHQLVTYSTNLLGQSNIQLSTFPSDISRCQRGVFNVNSSPSRPPDRIYEPT